MKKRYKTAFLDLDGVCCDWMSATLALFDKTWVDYEANDFHLMDTIGVTEPEMWAKIDAVGTDFWTGLKLYDHTAELIALLEDVADEVVILTSPHRHPTCFAGKYAHLEEHFPDMKFVFTKWKYYCAEPDTILIDDWGHNVDKFIDAGGEAVVFPTPWNAKTLDIGNPVDAVRAYLG